MKLLRGEITGFGKWRQQHFDFSAGNQLIFGENEAGKSTLYQFILAILFGFPNTRRKWQPDYTPQDGTSYGGTLWIEVAPYGKIKIERFKQKNRAQALVYLPDGQVGGDDLLKRLLAPLNKELFQQVFTFQQDQLQQLEHLSEQELHEALVSLGLSGSSQLFEKRQAYLEQAGQIFKPKGQRLALNRQLAHWTRLKQQIEEKEQQESYYGKLLSRSQELEQETAALEAELAQVRKLQLQLKQQQLNWKNYEEWQELKSCEPEAALSSQVVAQLQEFYQRWQQRNRTIEELEVKLERYSGQSQQTARYYFYLEQEEAIQELLEQRLSVQRLLDEQQTLLQTARSLDYLNEIPAAWKVTPPQPFADPEELIEHYRRLEQTELQSQQTKSRQKQQQQRQAQLETDLNCLEQEHPSLSGQKQQTPPQMRYALIGAAALCLLTLILLPSFWRLLPLAGLLAAGFVWYRQSKGSDEAIKAEWQKLLTQLDDSTSQLIETEKQVQQLRQAANKQQEQLQRLVTGHRLPQAERLADALKWNQRAQEFVAGSQKQEANYQRQQEIQSELNAVTAQFDFLTEWLPLMQEPLERKFQLLERFKEEMEQLRFAESYQQNTLLKQQINEQKKLQKAESLQASALLAACKLHYPSEIPGLLQKDQQQKTARERLAELTEQVTKLFADTPTLLQWQQRSLENQRQEEELRQRLSLLHQDYQRRQIEIDQLQADGTLDHLYQEASRQKSRILALAQEYAAQRLAADILQDLAAELSQQQLPQLLKKASHYFAILTERYSQLRLQDGQLGADDNGNFRPVYELSTGTKDQLIMAVRFGYLAMEAQQAASPVIIDDGWLHYDSRRKYRFAKLLTEFSRDYQVICLSSDREMVSYYQELSQNVWELEGA